MLDKEDGVKNHFSTVVVSGLTESKYLGLSSLLYNRHNTVQLYR